MYVSGHGVGPGGGKLAVPPLDLGSVAPRGEDDDKLEDTRLTSLLDHYDVTSRSWVGGASSTRVEDDDKLEDARSNFPPTAAGRRKHCSKPRHIRG